MSIQMWFLLIDVLYGEKIYMQLWEYINKISNKKYIKKKS